MPKIRKILHILQFHCEVYPYPFTVETKVESCLWRRCRPTGGFALVVGGRHKPFYGGSGGGIDIGNRQFYAIVTIKDFKVRGREATHIPPLRKSYNKCGRNGLHFGRTFCNCFEVLALTVLREDAC